MKLILPRHVEVVGIFIKILEEIRLFVVLHVEIKPIETFMLRETSYLDTLPEKSEW